MSSTIKNVLRKTCLILIIGFTFLTVSHAQAQQQTVVLRVDGDDGLAVPNPPDPGDTWSNAYKYLPDALDRAEFLILNDPQVDAVDLWVASTDPSNPYRPDRDAANEGGTGDRESTFLLNFNNVQVLGGFLGNETDPADRDPALYETVLSGDITFPLEDVCGPGNGKCFEPNGSPGCEDAACCATAFSGFS